MALAHQRCKYSYANVFKRYIWDPNCRRLPPDALLKLLELAAALGSSWRPTPAVALTLAELHLDRAALCGPAAAAAAATPAEGIVATQVGKQSCHLLSHIKN